LLQLSNATYAQLTDQSALSAEKCFVVWNELVDHSNPDAVNGTITRRLPCPDGWVYDKDPIETSIVTDVGIQ